MSEVVIYTDGGCAPNPGKGGWGCVMFHKNTMREFRKGYYKTTNNRMELLAAIENLERLKRPCSVELYSDSEYVINGARSWIRGWKAKGWKTSGGTRVKNVDLWKRMDICLAQHKVTWIWVKGHDSHEYNERCDELATEAIEGEEKYVDEGYEGI